MGSGEGGFCKGKVVITESSEGQNQLIDRQSPIARVLQISGRTLTGQSSAIEVHDGTGCLQKVLLESPFGQGLTKGSIEPDVRRGLR